MAGRTVIVGPFSDRLDRIARTIYGSEQGGTVEALLDANPGLAEIAADVPAGTRINVPETVEAPISTVTRPWI